MQPCTIDLHAANTKRSAKIRVLIGLMVIISASSLVTIQVIDVFSLLCFILLMVILFVITFPWDAFKPMYIRMDNEACRALLITPDDAFAKTRLGPLRASRWEVAWSNISRITIRKVHVDFRLKNGRTESLPLSILMYTQIQELKQSLRLAAREIHITVIETN